MKLLHYDKHIRSALVDLADKEETFWMAVFDLVELCNEKAYEGREVTVEDVLETLEDWSDA